MAFCGCFCFLFFFSVAVDEYIAIAKEKHGYNMEQVIVHNLVTFLILIPLVPPYLDVGSRCHPQSVTGVLMNTVLFWRFSRC